MSDSESSEEENVIVRRPRIFRRRTLYTCMEFIYEFNERFRLEFEKFNIVLTGIGHLLVHPTKRNYALTPQEQLMIALHWLGSGMQYHGAADMHEISKATVCRVVHKVVSAINHVFLTQIVRWPRDVGRVINNFNAIASMPLVCGAVDGTLIKIDAPSRYENAFVDRHGNHSLNVMLVCGPSLEFYYVCANWPGSVSDARVLRNSSIYTRMEGGWRPFPGCVLLGDSIYPLKSWLIPPILRNEAQQSQIRFLRGHKKTRRVIECAIGILKEKFPCLNHLRLTIFACELIMCCVTLCNLSKNHNVNLNDLDQEDGNEDFINEVNNEVGEGGDEKLNYFYNHF